MSCGFEHEDGAYVLGALAPEERAAFEEHLSGCDACATSVRELAGLPGLLARVPVEVLDPDLGPARAPLPVPDTLLPGLVRRVRRARQRRTWTVAAAAAAAVLVAGTGVGIVTGHDDGAPRALPSAGPTTAAPLAFRPVGAEPISGWVSLTKVGWGTRLDLTCSYAEEDAAYAGGWGVTYVMVVTRKDGTTEQVASWKALPGKTMRIQAATASDVDDIAGVVVRTAAGKDVLRLNG
ncbi:MAG: anti-sigma factor family protein [Marmoricola sp.]